MNPVEFKGHNVVFAKDQEEYRPLPAWIDLDRNEVISCWSLSIKERITVLFTGKFWFRQYTFGERLQPQLPQVENPFKKG